MGIVILSAGLVFFVLITFIGEGSLYECCWLGGIMVLLGVILIWQGFKQNKERKNVK